MNKIQKRADVLLGLQWGDEGKGKIVDVLTPAYKVVARFQGGPNAGHTLEFDNKKIILHTIPSGIFHASALNLIGNGVVIDPVIFNKEFKSLNISEDAFFNSILISKKSHLILPSHRLLDAVYEQSKGNKKIGSTLKGIGPAYTDKIGRLNIRTGCIIQKNFMEKYEELKKTHFKIASSFGCVNDIQIEGMDFDEYEKLWFDGLELLKSLQMVDSEMFINKALQNGSSVLAEGAQGSLLDIDFGSYPFVTSSNTITASACIGLGLPPSSIGEVYGIFKAYCTRVGSGPFPTELFDDNGEALRKNGREFGSTTGRPRRCGWLDLPALKYAVMLNGVTKLIMTKADVLDSFDNIDVCTHYNLKNKNIDYVPFNIDDKELKPVYKSFKGWKTNIDNIDSFEQIPNELMQLIKYIEEYIKVPVCMVSTGPNRKQLIKRGMETKTSL